MKLQLHCMPYMKSSFFSLHAVRFPQNHQGECHCHAPLGQSPNAVEQPRTLVTNFDFHGKIHVFKRLSEGHLCLFKTRWDRKGIIFGGRRLQLPVPLGSFVGEMHCLSPPQTHTHNKPSFGQGFRKTISVQSKDFKNQVAGRPGIGGGTT